MVWKLLIIEQFINENWIKSKLQIVLELGAVLVLLENNQWVKLIIFISYFLNQNVEDIVFWI